MSYNGHRSWAAWNVSLWLSNDEGLYTLARDHMRRALGSKDRAASALLNHLEELGIKETPDGAKYTITTIREALRGINE